MAVAPSGGDHLPPACGTGRLLLKHPGNRLIDISKNPRIARAAIE